MFSWQPLFHILTYNIGLGFHFPTFPVDFQIIFFGRNLVRWQLRIQKEKKSAKSVGTIVWSYTRVTINLYVIYK